MDDDIDIEEHDVLDDPRIKSIFPDLSQVKIEVPDDVDMEAQEMEDDEDQESFLYQYDYNSVSENHFNSLPSNSHDDEDISETGIPYEEDYEHYDYQADEIDMAAATEDANSDFVEINHISDSDFVSNKIILGSKPDYETLYEEAITSQSMVVLEDWSDRLYSSPCFCKDCKTLFSTVNALDAHKMVSHSYLVAVQKNTARKSTSIQTSNVAKKSTVSKVGRLCNHCNVVFSDDTALIKHLYELLPMSNYTPSVANKTGSVATKNISSNFKSETIIVKKEFDLDNSSVASKSTSVGSSKYTPNKNVDTPSIHYKCVKCNEILTSNYSARRHRKLRHPTLTHIRLFTKRKIEIQKTPRIKGKIFLATLIPKSILFQCGKCQLHFLSGYSALHHYMMCVKGKGLYMNCGKCHRRISWKDRKKHAIQHDHGEDRFKVHTVVNKVIYEKTLCKCPKCLICFDEVSFWVHSRNCTRVQFMPCDICKLDIVESKFKNHEFKHKRKKFTKKDFIVIDFIDQDDIKHEHAAKNHMASKFTAKNDTIDKATTKNDTITKATAKNDTIVQANAKNDIDIFAKFKQGKSDLFYCRYCFCCQHILSYKGHTNGKCRDWKINRGKKLCEDCGLIFSTKTYFKHKTIHEGQVVKVQDFRFTDLHTGEIIDPPINDVICCVTCYINFTNTFNLYHHNCKTEKFKICTFCNKKYNLKAYDLHKQFHKNINEVIMPELIEKYNSLSSMWNLIYMCANCDIVTLTYDSAVEHSQRHIVGSANDVSIQCRICHLSIDQAYYKSHSDLHEKNTKITKQSFKILKYNYETLFKETWMSLFKGELDIDVILSKSVYKDVRNVKMNVIGNSDNIKYYCNSCKTSVDDVKIHLEVNCKEAKKYRCKYCKMKLNNLSNLTMHESRHENNRLAVKIVTFNDECDKKFNIKLNKFAVASIANKLSKKQVENSAKNKKFKLYCCKKCTICVVSKHALPLHNCIANINRRYCSECNRYFSYQNLLNHLRAHKKFPNLSKKTLSITYFGDDDDNLKLNNVKKEDVTSVSYIYKCNCGLHFTSLGTVEKHLEVCGIDTDMSKEKCSKCNLLFPTNVLVTHLCNHHTNNGVKVMVKNVVKRNFKQCFACKILFPTKKDIDKHYDICNKNGSKCKNCGNLFLKTYLDKHVCGENDETHYIDTIEVIKKEWLMFSVFKCEKCNFCFWSQKCFKSHIKGNHKYVRKPLKCKVCSLYFTKTSFLQHIPLHRVSEEYRIKVFTNEKDYKIIKGRNKMVPKTGRTAHSTRYNENDFIDTGDETINKNEKSVVKTKPEPRVVTYKERTDSLNLTNNSEGSNESNLSLPNRIKFEDELNTKMSDRLMSQIMRSPFTNKLYRCPKCTLNYLNTRSLDYHLARHSIFVKICPCEACGLHFTSKSLTRHQFIHHESLKLSLKDIDIVKPCGDTITDSPDNTVNDLTDQSLNESISIEEIDSQDCNEQNSEDSNTATTIDNNKLKNSIDGNSKLEKLLKIDRKEIIKSSFDEKTIDSTKEEIRIYKCGECNVCFITRPEGLKHVNNHSKIDPKLYIECKICNFPFLITSLNTHMKVHHSKEFKLEDVLIEEYNVIGNDMATKIDVYYAVQSRLVSTTTDLGKDYS